MRTSFHPSRDILPVAVALLLTACAADDLPSDRSGARDSAARTPVIATTPAASGGVELLGDTAQGQPSRPGQGGTREPAARTGAGNGSVSRAAPAAPAPAPAERRSIIINGIDFTNIGYDRGRPDAKVVVVNFSDFGCPYCAKFEQETYPVLHREFVETGKVFYKYVPFAAGMFPNGDAAAKASECAGEAGAFWAMHDRLYEAQRDWKRTSSPAELFGGLAAGLVEQARFDACYARHGTHPRTAAANAAADRLGVRVTPSFVVNNRPIEGALPLADFRTLLTELLR